MKRLALCLVPAFLAACASSPTQHSTLQMATVATHHTTVATTVTDAGAWLRAAPVQTRVMQNSDGTTWVGFWVDTPAVTGAAQRPPLDVALVVDTSGSIAAARSPTRASPPRASSTASPTATSCRCTPSAIR